MRRISRRENKKQRHARVRKITASAGGAARELIRAGYENDEGDASCVLGIFG